MEQQFEFRKIIFFVGLPIFAAVILVLIIASRLYGLELQKEFFGSPFVLNLFTVFILSVAIIILAVSRSLDPQSVGTLLGRIAGYVLGSSKKT